VICETTEHLSGFASSARTTETPDLPSIPEEVSLT
jgi:hypothetical protein